MSGYTRLQNPFVGLRPFESEEASTSLAARNRPS